MRVPVTTTPSNLAAEREGARYIIQNSGTVDVYLARSQSECNATDYDQLLPAGYETSVLIAGTQFEEGSLWARTATGTSNLHLLREA